jgi:RNA polymerase sigma-70 factor (ECF subfamily)
MDHAMDQDDKAARVRAALDALPDRTRTVFRLHGVIGLEISDIARGLNIPAAEVEQHLADALVAIAQAVDGTAR